MFVPFKPLNILCWRFPIFQIFYTMTAVEDLDEWQQKTVGLTESADLVNLEKYAQYAIAVAARTRTGLGRLSEKVTVKVKPEDVPLNLRAHDVNTHSMTLSWSPPIRLNPINYKVCVKCCVRLPSYFVMFI